MLGWIKLWLEMAVVEDDGKGGQCRTNRARRERKGTPQGAPISPLLSNVYMRRFLLRWKLLGLARRFGAEIVNYADDFVIYGKAPAEAMRAAVERIMEQLRLPLNATKTHCLRTPEEPFEFLGVRRRSRFSDRRCEPHLRTALRGARHPPCRRRVRRYQHRALPDGRLHFVLSPDGVPRGDGFGARVQASPGTGGWTAFPPGTAGTTATRAATYGAPARAHGHGDSVHMHSDVDVRARYATDPGRSTVKISSEWAARSARIVGRFRVSVHATRSEVSGLWSSGVGASCRQYAATPANERTSPLILGIIGAATRRSGGRPRAHPPAQPPPASRSVPKPRRVISNSEMRLNAVRTEE